MTSLQPKPKGHFEIRYGESTPYFKSKTNNAVTQSIPYYEDINVLGAISSENDGVKIANARVETQQGTQIWKFEKNTNTNTNPKFVERTTIKTDEGSTSWTKYGHSERAKRSDFDKEGKAVASSQSLAEMAAEKNVNAKDQI